MTIPNSQSKEPAVVAGISMSTIVGAFYLIDQFFPNVLNDKNETLILVILTLILPVATALITRNKVWSPSSVQEAVDAAVYDALKIVKEKNGTIPAGLPVAEDFKDK